MSTVDTLPANHCPRCKAGWEHHELPFASSATQLAIRRSWLRPGRLYCPDGLACTSEEPFLQKAMERAEEEDGSFEVIASHTENTSQYVFWLPRERNNWVSVKGDVVMRLLGLKIPPGDNRIRIKAEFVKKRDDS